MKDALISIVMPVKNALPYLDDCLNSISQQSYLNWELLAVNDHSSDDSYSILKEYAEKDSRIKIFNNSGNGIIDALQLAYGKSNGALITRMDADDLMDKDKLSVLSASLLVHGKGHIAIGKVKYFAETILGDGYQNYERWLNGLTEKGNNFSEIYKECVVPSPCWLVFKDDFEKCNAFNSNIYPEDYDLCFRFYENGLICIPCHETLHHWRDYAIRSSRTSDHYADNRFLSLKCHYFTKLNYDSNRPLIIWGAGKKGKQIAQNLLEKKIEFNWACNNPNKIGKDIYGVNLISIEAAKGHKNPQYIVAVANKVEQQELKNYFRSFNLESMKDYFFFC